MPTPTGDCVNIALHNALAGRKAGAEDVSELDIRIGGANKALTTNVAFELAENQLANSLADMKSKYICLSPKPSNKKNGLSLGNTNFLNGNGVKNGTSNGVKNGNGVNGVKVNPDSVLPSPKIVLFPPEKVTLGWKGRPPVGAGMYNLGNTCYLNSILQALFHVPAFVNWLLSDQDHRKKCEIENGPSCGDCVTCALAKTLLASRNSTTMRPELITSKLRMICRSLSVGAEEDAHEFMRYLLENVEKGFLKRCPQKKLDPYSRETTPINQIFGGYMRTEVTCRTCGNVSTTFQHFQDVLLDIRKVSKVDEALDQYFSKEVLDGPNAYRCEKCKQVSPATKKYSIERPPKVLCVQLKRFTGSGNKIQKSVEVKQKLSLQKYLNPASSHRASNVPLRYKLIAMVTHSGQFAGGGHYTAIAETASSSYYLFDDASVRQIPFNSVVNTSAYILFFEMEVPAALNGQRENQPLGKAMLNKVLPNKAMPSTITSNGNGSSNGSPYTPLANKNWEKVVQPNPRLIIHSKKSKVSLEKEAESEAEAKVGAKAETDAGFIGPRLPTDTKAGFGSSVEATSSLLVKDENAPKKRYLDGTVKVADEKKNGKTSLVCYEDSSSESSLSPAPDASQSLTAKATTPNDWHVTASPSVRNSVSVSSESSSKISWSVKRRPSPSPRQVKSTTCFSDSEKDGNAGENKLPRAASIESPQSELPGVTKIPPTPAAVLNTNGIREKFFEGKNSAGNEYDRTISDCRDSRDRSTDKDHYGRNGCRSDESNDSHCSRWRNGSGARNGGAGRSESSNRHQGSSERVSADRGMNPWKKDQPDVLHSLHRLSHTGIDDRLYSWDNGWSNLERAVDEDRRLTRKSSDYDEEMDRGRVKKMRLQREFSKHNHFNNHQNRNPNHSRNNRNYPRYEPYKFHCYSSNRRIHNPNNYRKNSRHFKRQY